MSLDMEKKGWPPGITADHVKASVACLESVCEDARSQGLESNGMWYALDRVTYMAELSQALLSGDVATVERLAPAKSWLR